MSVLKTAASLRITVTLFVLSIILVFFGTVAQVNLGIWTVVNHYFRSALVWIPFDVLTLRVVQNPELEPSNAGLPYPGGWLLGGLLLVNLLAAHAIRFKISWRRSGILLIHAGLIVLMLSELITGLYAIEGHMHIQEGQSANFTERSQYPELAFVRQADEKKDAVVVVPTSLLVQGGLIQDDNLPFDVEIKKYMVNSQLKNLEAGVANLATVGKGLDVRAVERPEGSGVDTDQRVDTASAYVTLKEKGTGKDLGTYLVSVLLDNQWVKAGDKEYQFSLRFRRDYKPYTFHLLKFTHDVYPGTTKPKDFKSEVRLVDPSNKEDRKESIYMNHPLRYEGETFYQSGTIPDPTGRSIGTILQVVRNPAWLMPYISCVMVSLGMMIHFGIHLTRFLERSLAS